MLSKRINLNEVSQMRTDIKTLYIDFDGTLVNTIESIVDLYNEDFKYYKNFNYIRWCDIDTYF